MKSLKIKIAGLILTAGLLISGTIDLNELFNYSNQNKPDFISDALDNVPGNNTMDDKIATLGRVLFYDKKLSSNNNVSCASCHEQEHAFGLIPLQGVGVNGLSLRRPMRLVNLRQREEFEGFFWDERAFSLEDLATIPIKDHIEMGYSGEHGDPTFDDLLIKLSQIDYYDQLFTFAFGDNTIDEDRISKSLAQFLRSIQSYDSKFDIGYESVGGNEFGTNITTDFPNFTTEENQGKLLFMTDPILQSDIRIGGGVGCFHCHSGPNFHFVVEKSNNGVITEINGDEVLNITKSPTLRDVFGPDGSLNGPLFHNGQAATFNELLDHYNMIVQNPNIDIRLSPNSFGRNLNLTIQERNQLEAFAKTLTGTDIYTNEKWSNPFDENGEIEIIGGTVNTAFYTKKKGLEVLPNPAKDYITVRGADGNKMLLNIFSTDGSLVMTAPTTVGQRINVSELANGIYLINLHSLDNTLVLSQRIVKTF